MARWLAVLGLTIWMTCIGCSREKLPGEAKYDAATAQLNAFNGVVGHGEDAASADLARRFAERAKTLDLQNFKGGLDQAEYEALGGNFLTYCKQTPTRVVFIVRVPSIEAYLNNRQLVTRVLWAAARPLLPEIGNRKLIIAGRGASPGIRLLFEDFPKAMSPEGWFGTISDPAKAELYALFQASQ